MKYLAAVFSIIGIVICVNHHNWTVDQITDAFIRKIDANRDGNLTDAEITHEIVNHYDHDQNGCASYKEFVHQWTKEYHDDHQTASAFYHALEDDIDGCFNADDITRHDVEIDTDNDGTITPDEFRAWMHKVHPVGKHNNGGVFG